LARGVSEFNRPFVALLDAAGEKAGVSVEWLSDFWIARLSSGGEEEFVYGSVFPLNSASVARLATDKVATSMVLESASVPSVRHHLIRFPSFSYDESAAVRVLSVLPTPWVLKPAKESGGMDVRKALTDEEARNALKELSTRYLALAASPWLDIVDEYRVVMLDGRSKLAYRKTIPRSPGGAAQEWRHNLGHGAVPVLERDPEVCARLEETARGAMSALGARFMTVDIVSVGDEHLVLEVNSGVSLGRFGQASREYREIAVSVYAEALGEVFGKPS
jgi:glutathione synthase/RimK-type ligase-like ATP-grasp enzyme